MKSPKLLLTISVLLTSLHLQAQRAVLVNKSDSIKSIAYKVYKLKTKNNTINKSKPAVPFDGYPIQYPLAKFFFNTDGLIIKKSRSYQKDTIHYNSKNQKIKMVIYINRKRDSITFDYTYDRFGNIESVKKQASAPKLDYSLNDNHYSSNALIDELYKNYYSSEESSYVKNQFESIKPEPNCNYRLYTDENELVEEKYVTIHKRPFPYKPDSTIHLIKYQYSKEHKVSEISTIEEKINTIDKNYTSTETEQHEYLNNGLIHEVKYVANNKIWKVVQSVYNVNGILSAYTKHLPNLNRTEKYVYDSKGELNQYTLINTKKNKIIRNIILKYTYNHKGHWIKCIHYDNKNSPEYLIERIIEYE